jgi:hypothetical protein
MNRENRISSVVAISESASICQQAKLSSIEAAYYSSAICTLEKWGAQYFAERLSREIDRYTGSGSQSTNEITQLLRRGLCSKFANCPTVWQSRYWWSNTSSRMKEQFRNSGDGSRLKSISVYAVSCWLGVALTRVGLSLHNKNVE